MPTFTFTTFLSRSFEPSDTSAIVPDVPVMAKNSVVRVPSHSILYLVLTVVFALLALFLLTYFAYNVIQRHQSKVGSPRFMPRLFPLKTDVRDYDDPDLETGTGSTPETNVKSKISEPILRFGTGAIALNYDICRSEDTGEIYSTDTIFGRERSPFLGDEGSHDGDLYDFRRSKVRSGLGASDSVSPAVDEAGKLGAVSYKSLRMSDNDNNATEGVGQLKVDIETLRSKWESWNNETGVGRDPFGDEFIASKGLEEGALHIGNVDTDISEEPSSICSLSSSYSTFDIHELDSSISSWEEPSKAKSPSSQRCGVLKRPVSTFGSKKAARFNLYCHRLKIQSNPELRASILNPFLRDPTTYKRATFPQWYCLEPMRPESIRKEIRCNVQRRAVAPYRPALSSPLSSPFVIYGPGCLAVDKSRRGSCELITLNDATCDLCTSSTTISDEKLSDEKPVDALKLKLKKAYPDTQATRPCLSLLQLMMESDSLSPDSGLQSVFMPDPLPLFFSPESDATSTPAVKRVTAPVGVIDPESTSVTTPYSDKRTMTNITDLRARLRTTLGRSCSEKKSPSIPCAQIPKCSEDTEGNMSSQYSVRQTTIDETHTTISQASSKRLSAMVADGQRLPSTAPAKSFKRPGHGVRTQTQLVMTRSPHDAPTTINNLASKESGVASPPGARSIRSRNDRLVTVQPNQQFSRATTTAARTCLAQPEKSLLTKRFSFSTCPSKMSSHSNRRSLSDITSSSLNSRPSRRSEPGVSPSQRSHPFVTSRTAAPAQLCRNPSSSSNAKENFPKQSLQRTVPCTAIASPSPPWF